MMNAAGYDVMAAGNHEFDYGSDRLLSNAAAADSPILSANATFTGTIRKPAGKLDPKGRATRAEAAAMLMRFCEGE